LFSHLICGCFDSHPLEATIPSLQYSPTKQYLQSHSIVEDILALYPHEDVTNIIRTIEIILTGEKEHIWESFYGPESSSKIVIQWILECLTFPCTYTTIQTYTSSDLLSQRLTLTLGMIQLHSTNQPMVYEYYEKQFLRWCNGGDGEEVCYPIEQSCILERMLLLFMLGYDPLNTNHMEYIDNLLTPEKSINKNEEWLLAHYQVCKTPTFLKEYSKNILVPIQKAMNVRKMKSSSSSSAASSSSLITLYLNQLIMNITVSFSMKQFLDLLPILREKLTAQTIAQLHTSSSSSLLLGNSDNENDNDSDITTDGSMAISHEEHIFHLWLHINLLLIEFGLMNKELLSSAVFQFICIVTTKYIDIFPKSRMDRIMIYVGKYYGIKLDDELMNYEYSTVDYETLYTLSQSIYIPTLLHCLITSLNPQQDMVLESIVCRSNLWKQLCLQHTIPIVFQAMLKVFGILGEYLSTHTMDTRRKGMLANAAPKLLKCFEPFLTNPEFYAEYNTKKFELLKLVKSKKAVMNILEQHFK